MARTYQLRRRAVRQDETRQKIIAAAVDLHCAQGPARTSILAIAERAGVERPTVYRHFPTPDSLYAACSTHFWTLNPVPDPEPWTAIADGEARLKEGLAAVYGFYDRLEPALWNILRDLEDIPELRKFCTATARWARLGDVLAAPYSRDGAPSRAIGIVLAHALDFFGWRGMRRRGASNDEIIALITAMIRGCEVIEVPAVPKHDAH